MPYIKPEDREIWDLFEIDPLHMTKGDLNYCISKLMLGFVRCNGKSYQTLSDAIAAANDAAAEFRRRMMDPYEDKKIKENGDIYG